MSPFSRSGSICRIDDGFPGTPIGYSMESDTALIPRPPGVTIVYGSLIPGHGPYLDALLSNSNGSFRPETGSLSDPLAPANYLGLQTRSERS